MNDKSTPHDVALNSMVSRISASSLPFATRKNSFIINDVPTDLHVTTDEHMLATILSSLLNTVIAHTKACCIRISAKLYGRIVLFQLKESDHMSSPALAASLRQVQQLAESIGGTINVSHDRDG